MSTGIIVLIVVAALIVALALWAVGVYNGLVRRRNASTEALRGIDVALETRYDQVSQQAQVVEGAVGKEVETVLGATALRTGRSIREMSVKEKSELHAALDDAQRRIVEAPGALASFEAYPQMRSLANVEVLQRTVNETEERLQAARRAYNAAATDYNTARQSFPTVLIAGVLGFGHHDLFELTNAVKREQADLGGFLGGGAHQTGGAPADRTSADGRRA